MKVITGQELVVTAIDNTPASRGVSVADATTAGGQGLKAAIESTDTSVQTYAVTDSADGVKADGVALVTGDKLLVTAADGVTTVVYTVTKNYFFLLTN